MIQKVAINKDFSDRAISRKLKILYGPKAFCLNLIYLASMITCLVSSGCFSHGYVWARNCDIASSFDLYLLSIRLCVDYIVMFIYCPNNNIKPYICIFHWGFF